MTSSAQILPPPETVLQYLDGVAPLHEAVRLALRGNDVSDRELLDERNSTAKTVATAIALLNLRRAPASSAAVTPDSTLTDFLPREAVALAGFGEWLQQITLLDEAKGIDVRGLFAHFIATALAARAVARCEPRLDVRSDDAFLAGLMHDLGKPAILSIFPRGFSRIFARTEELRGDIADQERSTLGIDHTIAGRYLAERWGLPRSVRDVIWLHHLATDVLPAIVLKPHLVKLVRLADVLAREAHIGNSGNHRYYESSRDLAERLSLDLRVIEWVHESLEADTNVVLERLAGCSGRMVVRVTHRIAHAESPPSAGEPQERRVLDAITEFDHGCGETPDVRVVVRSLARSASTVLGIDRATAFASAEASTQVVATFDRATGFVDVAPRFESGLGELTEMAPLVTHAACVLAPRTICERFSDSLRTAGNGRVWLIPLCRGGAPLGGLLFRMAGDIHHDAGLFPPDFNAFCDHAARVLGLVMDCQSSQRLSDDLAEANRRMQHAQLESLRNKALSMIAEMAAGAGHEMNSPLAVISGRAQMLAREFDDSSVRRSLEIISEKAHECSQIVSELMDFARPRPPHSVEFDIAQRIREHAPGWAAEIVLPESRLSVSLPDSLPVVRGDVDQIDSVLRELLRNAANAVAMNGGQIFISGRIATLGDGVEILIRDTGCGMSSAVTQRAFDPFFSHREAGRGRGLGLPRAHRIIEAHDGRIWLESTADEGTTARIFLPLAASREATLQPTPHRIVRRVS